jgi:hypothetical protein
MTQMKATFPAFLASIVLSVVLAGSTENAFAAAFLQASSTDPQLATDTKPKVVVMNSTDAASGMTNKDGVVTASEDGAYFVVAAGQVGGSTKGSVRIWMRVNGTDVDNSNTEQFIAEPAFTAVLVCQGVMELKKGDKVEVMYSATAPGLGLIVKKPAGEPVVTSIIFSAFKLN